jgi:NAD(P)-dependent dehydrogenase (short-subunit alcohol dehydrogenase family)
MKFPEVESRTVLVTGCSSGIGLATARLLREHGWTVIPTVRKTEDFKRLEADGFEPLFLDLFDTESVQNAATETLKRTDGKIGAIVNNAGYGQPGAVEDLTREALRRQFEVNLFGLIELTNAFLPAMREQGRGRIVNIASVLGQISMPFNGAYSASKFALEAISDAQRVELSTTGIAVSIIEPGPIATRFGTNAHAQATDSHIRPSSRFSDHYRRYFATADKPKSKPSLGDSFRLPPEAVARRILHALESERPRIRYRVTFPAHFGAFLRRFMPASAIDRFFIRHLTKKLS